MTTKLKRGWLMQLLKMSHDSLMTRSYAVSWQTKIAISPIPQIIWTPYSTGWILLTWGYHSKNCIPISKKFFPFIHFFPPAMYLSLIQISTIHTYVLFAIFSSSVETKKEIVISNFLLLNPVKFTDS